VRLLREESTSFERELSGEASASPLSSKIEDSAKNSRAINTYSLQRAINYTIKVTISGIGIQRLVEGKHIESSRIRLDKHKKVLGIESQRCRNVSKKIGLYLVEADAGNEKVYFC
jgi:hypothetical protein